MGKVELPRSATPAGINEAFEHTKEEVLKHTITHELGHMAGASHTGDDTDVMYVNTNNWRRDGNFGSSISQLKIHNTPANPQEP